jgi:hypothetical protein
MAFMAMWLNAPIWFYDSGIIYDVDAECVERPADRRICISGARGGTVPKEAR